MTDGVWSSESAKTKGAFANVDSSDGPVITAPNGTSYTYKPTPPYQDGASSTLADVAMYYWNHDLRPDLPNNVPTSSQDPAFWQHLVNYTIGFGVTGKLQNPRDLKGLEAGTIKWGDPGDPPLLPTTEDALRALKVAQTEIRVDDLWHAAINSRGLARSARSLDEYKDALKTIIEDIQSRDASEAGVAASSATYSATAQKFVPTYQSENWTGDVEAIALDGAKRIWLASEKLPKFGDRKIFTYTGSSGITFDFKSLDEAKLTSLLDTTDASELIDYLRGSRAKEGSGLRPRNKLIGDIVNSTPILVKDLVNEQYVFLPASTPGRSTYQSFVDAKAKRVAQLFVGANDGMLHAFNAGDGDSKGVETFAFVPKAVLGKVKQLADVAYTHSYFVDGGLAEVDVYDPAAERWRNIVLGGGGAGAKNLFAVNVPVAKTSASQETVGLTDAESAPGASDILWEIGSDTTGYEQLGHVLRAPKAGLLQNGRWAVVVGNGYDSAKGTAQLFLIDAVTGAKIASIDTGKGSVAEPNGLGGIGLVLDNQRRIVAAYAGDVQGHLWKFDLSSGNPRDWAVAFGGNPLFTARNTKGDVEPITAAPSFARHPLGGVMVLAGSGKLFEDGDKASEDERSLYGVWDTVAVGQKSDSASAALTDNKLLVVQSMAALDTNLAFFTVSRNAVDYGGVNGSQANRGWRLPLTAIVGQRLIYDVRLKGGRGIFDTMAPGGKGGQCDASGAVGAIFVLDPFTGSAGQDAPTFDTDRNGTHDSQDSAEVGGALTSSAGTTALLGDRGGKAVASSAPGGSASAGPPPDHSLRLGTVPVRRQWRQIATPPAY